MNHFEMPTLRQRKKPNIDLSELQELQTSAKANNNLQLSQSQSPTTSQLTGLTITVETQGHICPKVTATSAEGANYRLTFHRIKKPDIKLYRGQETDAAPAAVAYIHSWSRIYHIGVGDDEASREWVKSKTKVYPKRPTFEWKGETYVLARVSKDEDGEKLEKAKWRSYFGVKDGAGKYVALSLPVRKGKRVIKFAEGVSEALGLVILLAICSWQEETRRAG